MQNQVHSQVKHYYGQSLQSSQDLLTNACCVGKSTLTHKQKEIMSMIDGEVIGKFYGCGSPIPPQLQGTVVVDLGCGSGVDVYLASYFVKQTGKVIGIDMTPSQLEIAKKHLPMMTQKYGFSQPNIDFRLGNIEKIDMEDASVDVVISNCVLNLVPEKKVVFKEIWRILKNGGELYFSDVYSDRRINEINQKDKVLWGQCLSGALYIEDFRRIMAEVGCLDCRIVSKSKITINNPKIQQQLKGISFYSITYRCFKIGELEDRCEDFGQTVTYKGGIQDHEEQFVLDNGHVFKKNDKVEVCGNTADMCFRTRYAKYFEVTPKQQHRGLFDCSKSESKGCEGSSCC